MAHSVSDETPLLRSTKHEEIYDRFKPAQKRRVVAIVAVTGLLPIFVERSFIPSILQIAKDLDSTGSVVSLAVSLSVLATSLGSLLGASYSTFYGRKPVYLVGTPLLFVGSLGVASSRNIPQLMVWRFIQALGASPGLAVGSGVIGDLYKLEERGQALGIFFAAVLLVSAVAPLAGGIAAHYYSWRLMQVWLGAIGLLMFFILLYFFPETYHPGERGVDKADPLSLPTWRPVIINPLQPLWLLRSPNLSFVTIAGFVASLTDYVLVVPFAYTIGVKYNIKNEAIIGACLLPCGLGSMVGAPLAGRISDRIIVYYRKKRGGKWYPEDRLRAPLFGALFLVPFSVMASGLLTEYVPGKIGLSLNLVCLFLNGVGIDFVVTPSAAYSVDLMHSRSAEVIAANHGFRGFATGLAITGIIAMINKYGVVVTNMSSALFAQVGFLLLLVTIRYGDRLRGMVDVGFSTADSN